VSVAGEGTKFAEKFIDGVGRGERLSFLRAARTGEFKDVKGGDRLKAAGHIMGGYLDEAVEKGGFSNAWSMAGHHAIRGAVGGAAIGGTASVLNGGDFWDGAKAGAFKGATIYGGLRMGAAATGAENWMNPLAGKGKGMLSGAYNIHAVTGGKNVKVSRAAAKILAQREGDGLTRGVMNIKNNMK
jgi:hypothetical protein